VDGKITDFAYDSLSRIVLAASQLAFNDMGCSRTQNTYDKNLIMLKFIRLRLTCFRSRTIKHVRQKPLATDKTMFLLTY
jgi:hypothetical protein